MRILSGVADRYLRQLSWLLIFLPAIAQAERKVPFVAPLTYCPGSPIVLSIGVMNLGEPSAGGSVTSSGVDVKATLKYLDLTGAPAEDTFHTVLSLAPGATEKAAFQTTKDAGGGCYRQAVVSGWLTVLDSGAPSIQASGNLSGVVVLGNTMMPATNSFSINGDHAF